MWFYYKCHFQLQHDRLFGIIVLWLINFKTFTLLNNQFLKKVKGWVSTTNTNWQYRMTQNWRRNKSKIFFYLAEHDNFMDNFVSVDPTKLSMQATITLHNLWKLHLLIYWTLKRPKQADVYCRHLMMLAIAKIFKITCAVRRA